MDDTPEGGEITVAVHRLQTGQVGGTFVMRTEHLKVWLRELMQENDPGTRRWDKLVSVAKLAFQEGHILMALSWTTMVLITMGGGEYRGVGLV